MTRIGILIDMYGSLGCTPEEEVTDIVEQFKTEGLDPHLISWGHDISKATERPIDVLVVDYGGVMVGGTDDLALDQVHRALDWADAHPSRLLILWTDFTRMIYKTELERQFGELTNVLYRYRDDYLGDRFWQDICGWLNIHPQKPQEAKLEVPERKSHVT